MPNTAATTIYWNGQILHRIGPPQVSQTAQGDAEPMFGMSPTSKAYGFRKGQKAAYSITFSVPVLQGTQEVDWSSLARRKTEGVLQIQTADHSDIYACCVVRCEAKTDDRRAVMWDVTLIALGVESAP
jgi:hypothetical protein